MTQFNAKPHITTRGGQLVVEYRVPSIKAAGVTLFPGQTLPAPRSSSLFGFIHESFSGAWQRNIELEPNENIAQFATIYACISLISNDIAKLRIKLVELQSTGIWKEIQIPAFSPVLRKPNDYQTRIQFIAYWIVCKLFGGRAGGNAYILLERDEREVVIRQHVLDPDMVTPLIAEDGSVFYRLKKDNLAKIEEDDLVVPASEIIHDRMNCLFHPLVGIGPIFAASFSAIQGIKIQRQSAKSFADGLRPVGLLTVPGNLTDKQAAEFKLAWDTNYGPGGIGGTAVLGGGMTYTPMSMPAIQAQLIEQLKWTVEDCARAFHVPLHKLGMGQPTLNNIGALNQDYYAQALQTHIESIELLLDEALGLPALGYGVELDIDGLMRMDPLSQAETGAKLVGAGIQMPDEARFKLNYEPVPGGNTPYLQVQNYSLAALAKRDSKPDPFATAPVAPPPDKTVAEDVVSRLLPALQERRIDVAVNLPTDAIDKLRGDLIGLEARLTSTDQEDKLKEMVMGWMESVGMKIDAIKMPDVTPQFDALNKQISELSPTDYTAQLADIAKQIADRPQIPLEVVEQFDAVHKQLKVLGEKPVAPELMQEIESLRKEVESSKDEIEAKDFAAALINRFMEKVSG